MYQNEFFSSALLIYLILPVLPVSLNESIWREENMRKKMESKLKLNKNY